MFQSVAQTAAIVKLLITPLSISIRKNKAEILYLKADEPGRRETCIAHNID